MTMKKILTFSIAGLLIIVLISIGIIFLVTGKDTNAKEKIQYFQYELGELYTNIKDSNRILKANITIEYIDDKLNKNFEENKARITNDILELLRSKTYEELSGKEGQQKARNDILSKIRKIVNSDKITNIYFMEFIIQ